VTLNASAKKPKGNATTKDGKVRTKTNNELDTSFDRKALVDKISQRVEYIYIPSYQNMRKMIFKALRIMAKK
jgi:hypothetical protein